jgi:hypothetical protein
MAGKITWETVRKAGLALPSVQETTTRGAAALKGFGTLMVWMPDKKSLEPGTIAFRVEDEDRDELLAADPETYYVTDHYLNYNTVLVRPDKLNADAVRDMVGMAHKFVARRASPRSPARKSR